MQVNRKDVAGGALFIAIGLFFGLNALFNLRVGQALNMGPGYFPVVLGAVLIGFGVAIVIGGINKPSEAFGAVSWRGIILVTASVVFFAATVRRLGFGPATAISVFMAAMSPKQANIVAALLLSLGLAVFSVLVFIYALGLPYLVIGPWLGGLR